jgi:hypothetical protein
MVEINGQIQGLLHTRGQAVKDLKAKAMETAACAVRKIPDEAARSILFGTVSGQDAQVETW